MKRTIFRIKSVGTVICFLCIPLFFACSKEDEQDKVETDKATVVFTDEIDHQPFKVTSKGEWHLEAEGLESGYGTLVGQAEWYEVDRMYGEGNATVTITLNGVQPENRTETLTVVGKHNKVNVSLKQQITSD